MIARRLFTGAMPYAGPKVPFYVYRVLYAMLVAHRLLCPARAVYDAANITPPADYSGGAERYMQSKMF